MYLKKIGVLILVILKFLWKNILCRVYLKFLRFLNIIGNWFNLVWFNVLLIWEFKRGLVFLNRIVVIKKKVLIK